MLPPLKSYDYKWIPPSPSLGEGWQPGKCAICREENAVRYCGMCKAVMCGGCSAKYFERGVAFVKGLIREGYKGEVLIREEVRGDGS